MQTITARDLFRLAQQHSRPDVAVLTLPAPGHAVKPDCVMMCEAQLVAFVQALGLTVVQARRQRRGERPEHALEFDEPRAPLSFEGEPA